MIWWDEKIIHFCINLHKSKLYNMWLTLLLESGPGLFFNCASTASVYASLHTIVAKGWGKGNTKSGIVSLLCFSSFQMGPLPLLL